MLPWGLSPNLGNSGYLLGGDHELEMGEAPMTGGKRGDMKELSPTRPPESPVPGVPQWSSSKGYKMPPWTWCKPI